MIVEFELRGSKCLHKGIFDTQGFWVRYEVEMEMISPHGNIVTGYKIFSHFSFAFYHEEKEIVDQVYHALVDIIREGGEKILQDIGFIKVLEY